MATPNRHNRDETLTQTYPEFLTLLATDPDSAIAEFGMCARSWLLERPPPCLRTLRPEDREEVVGDLIHHLISDDASRLRGYQDKGSPFLAFLTTAAERRCKSWYRKKREALLIDQTDDDGRPAVEPVAPSTQLDSSLLARIVWEFVQDLDVECQLALTGHFNDGLKPSELVPLLGYSHLEQANKRASDRLRYCKTLLAQRIFAAGYERGDFLD